MFCWVYRHEGRKLKQELRCHAVLCPKESTARRMVTQLNTRLAQALTEFKRDKISRQNARLSLANSVYENPSMPRRKILLSTGSHNYRPPLERSKSAPKLMSIEESLEEEEECCDPRRSVRRTRPPSQKEEAFKKARRLSCGGLSERLMRIDTSILRSFGENRITNSSSEVNLKDNATDIEDVNSEDIDDKTVLNNPSGGDEPLPIRVMKRSMSLQSHVEDDDTTTDGECDDDTSRLNSISDDDLETASKISEEDLHDDDTCSEKTVEDLQQREKSPEISEDNTCLRIIWEGDNEELSLRCSTVENIEPDLELDCLSMSSRTNSLVRDRRKMFEKTLEDTGSISDKSVDKDASRSGMLVQNRRKLFENLLNPELHDDITEVFQISEQTVLDLDRLNRTRIDKGYLDLEEDSTPSLQSISSGSDTSTCRVSDLRVSGVKPNYDLDSLSEEDSDESGYVESVPAEGDDKARDLPHHQLMKSCILTPKTTQCLQV